jgi:cysteinyl-tRNA synthetase
MSARAAKGDPEFRIYNSMSTRVEVFTPADGKTVRMYSCGPTVYNPAHLGNFRSFLFYDLLRQALRLRGWDVRQVMNLTDVDDKIIKRAYAQRKTIGEVTEPITETFFKDRDYLRIKPADAYPKATEYIPQMIALVQRLLDKNVAYRAEDKSVYFAIGRFPKYGRLSRLDMREVKAGARVAQDEYTKEHAQDFVLWKAAKPEDEETGAAWDSPWGRGRPGWHLECSAMAIDLLGETLDVHTGGIDLRFPHHENEIAQSEAATGRQFARYWSHGAFLLTDGTKMSKRLGNVSSVKELREQKFSAAAIRHFMFTTHYRKELNLSDDALDASMEAVRRVGELAERLEEASGGTEALAEAADEAERVFRAALYDDLNAPEALAALFTFLKAANRELDKHGTDRQALDRARTVFALINGVLDIAPEREEAPAELAAWVEERIAARAAARQRGDFREADRIRGELTGRGIAVEDAGGGTRWKIVRAHSTS